MYVLPTASSARKNIGFKFELEDSRFLKSYIGYLRSEYNSQFFKHRKHSGFLDNLDLENIKANVEHNKIFSRYTLSTKKDGNIRIMNRENRPMKIVDGVVYTKINNRKKSFNLAKTSPGDGYYRGTITEVQGKPYIILDLKYFNEISYRSDKEKKIKANALQKLTTKIQEKRAMLKSIGFTRLNNADIKIGVHKRIKKQGKVDSVTATTVKSNRRHNVRLQKNLITELNVIFRECKGVDLLKKESASFAFLEMMNLSKVENQYFDIKKPLPLYIREKMLEEYRVNDPYTMSLLYEVLGFDDSLSLELNIR